MKAEYVRGSKEEHEDARLFQCPICNGKAYWRDMIISKGCNRTGKIPDGAVLVKEVKTMSGRTIYSWERHGYGIHCMTPKCRCRTIPDGYRTLDDAIEAWNGGRSK